MAAISAGKVDGQAFFAERFLNALDEHFDRVLIFTIGVFGFRATFVSANPVDDDDAGQVALAGGFYHPSGDDFNTRLRVNHDRDRFHRGQARDRLPDQIGRARRVD